MEVACVMGGTYENTVIPWRPGGQGRVPEFLFEEGFPVRIIGLDTELTWDGAEGVVDSYDEASGMVRIEFSDGRTKSVPKENCEPAMQMPRSSSVHSAPVVERKGHGGVKAKAQGAGPMK